MKRIWIAVVAIILIVGACIAENILTTTMPEKVDEKIKMSKICVQKGEYEAAESMIAEAKEDMQFTQSVLSTFTPHTRFDYIEHNISLLESLLENEEYDTFLVVSEQSDDLIEYIEQAEKLKIENIL